MKIINCATSNTIINQYVAELRDIKIQSDRGTFRYNLQRIGQLMAFEVSKTLHYSEKTIQTPLAMAKASPMASAPAIKMISTYRLPEKLPAIQL